MNEKDKPVSVEEAVCLVLNEHRLLHWRSNDDCDIGLLDALTPLMDEEVSRGREEVDALAEALIAAIPAEDRFEHYIATAIAKLDSDALAATERADRIKGTIGPDDYNVGWNRGYACALRSISAELHAALLAAAPTPQTKDKP
jgi:hypothetical protein